MIKIISLWKRRREQKTREQAIAEHRKMWNWIADETERTGQRVTKREYMSKHGVNIYLPHYCFLCAYSEKQARKHRRTRSGKCDYCPLDWSSNALCPCLDKQEENDLKGLFAQWELTSDIPRRVELARRIAELPKRDV